MAEIKISTKGLGDATLKDLNIMFHSPRGKVGMNRAGGRAVQSFLRKYHATYGRAGKWTNPSLPTWGAGRKSTRFATQVAAAWQAPVPDVDGVSVTNLDPRLSHKITGGVIKASSGKDLTIPMRPDAHGKSVSEWKAQYPKRKLFRPRGRNFLAFKLKSGALRIVYLLKKQITQAPWPNAMPTDQRILDAWWYGSGNKNDGVSKHLDAAIARLGTKAKTDV